VADQKQTQQPSQEDFAAKIAASVAAAVADATVRVQERIAPIESRAAGLKSPFNPEGLKVRPKLERRYIFCGGEMSEEFLTNKEIELLNKINKPGEFNGGRWRVRLRRNDGGNDTIFIDLPVKELDQRMELPNTLTAILDQIIAESSSPAA